MRSKIQPTGRSAALAVLLAAVGGAGCAAVGGARLSAAHPQAAAASPADRTDPATGAENARAVEAHVQADLDAVLAMAGTFAVSYRHAETAALAPGRALSEPYAAEARECVRVVARTTGRVSLQHLLLIGDAPLVVKHWREDWEHAAGRRLVYGGPVPGGGRWSVQAVSPTAGRWTRTVYGADDAPGYAAAGRWTHRGGVAGAGAVSEWEAEAPSAAPAARHETDRAAGDDAVDGGGAAWGRVRDRVVVQRGGVGGGWTREESVVKLDAGGTPLAREHGVIRYTRRGGGEPPAVTDYWRRVGGFWAAVRAGWERRLPPGATRVVRDRVADGPRWRALFSLADTHDADPARLDAVLDAAMQTVPE